MVEYLIKTTENTLEAIPHRKITSSSPNQNKEYHRYKCSGESYKSEKNLKRGLNKDKNTLFYFDIDKSNCRFYTLTTSKIIPYDDFNVHINNFVQKIRYYYPLIKFIKKIEFNEGSFHLHLHVIFIFNEAVPTSFNTQFVYSLWELGYVYHKTIYDLYSLYRYFCKFKPEHDLLENTPNCKLTKYPYGSRPLTWSKDIPTKQTNISIISEEKYKDTIDEFIERNNNLEPHLSCKYHTYIDQNTGALETCLDSLFYYYP